MSERDYKNRRVSDDDGEDIGEAAAGTVLFLVVMAVLIFFFLGA